jgi:hypothetical protein
LLLRYDAVTDVDATFAATSGRSTITQMGITVEISSGSVAEQGQACEALVEFAKRLSYQPANSTLISYSSRISWRCAQYGR